MGLDGPNIDWRDSTENFSTSGSITTGLGEGTVRSDSGGLLSSSKDCYGSMSVTNDSSTLPLNATATTFTKIDKFDVAGPSKNATIDVVTNDDIEVDVAGDYMISYGVSLQNQDIPADERVQVSVFVDGVELVFGIVRSNTAFTTATTSSFAFVSGCTIVTLSAGANIDLRVRCITTGSSTIRIRDAQLCVKKVS